MAARAKASEFTRNEKNTHREGGGEQGNARVFFNIDKTFGVALLPFHNWASAQPVSPGGEPSRIAREVYQEQPSVYSQKLEACMTCTPPRPFTMRPCKRTGTSRSPVRR